MTRLATTLDLAEAQEEVSHPVQSKKSLLTEETLQALEQEIHPTSILPTSKEMTRAQQSIANTVRNRGVTLVSSYHEPPKSGNRIQSAFQELMSARPSSREMVDSNRSFLLSNPSKFGTLERVARTLTSFVTQNWYYLRFFILGFAIFLGLLLFPPLLGAVIAL